MKGMKGKKLVDIINKTFLRVQSVPFQRIPQVQQNQHPPLDNPICIKPIPFKRSYSIQSKDIDEKQRYCRFFLF